MRRNYAIHPSVGMRSPTEFERAPDGGADEVSITFDPVMAPFWSRNLRGVSGAITPSGTVGTADVSRRVSFAGEAVAKFIMGVPRRFRWVTFLVSREALRHSRVWGNVVRLPVSVVYDKYQKAIARKWRLSYTPPPRLARAALSANGMSSTSLTSAEVMPNRDPSVDAQRRLIGEVFLLRSQVQDMMARRDLLVQKVKASARWELMKEWLETRVEYWNPEKEYRRHLFLSGGINHQSGSFSQAATPISIVGSRFRRSLLSE
uniref:Uncharacterized protein n=1 Tax=Brassica oleracea var. oleracea TaxID=109376 RepID=A0A0D3E8G8_BRAOL